MIETRFSVAPARSVYILTRSCPDIVSSSPLDPKEGEGRHQEKEWSITTFCCGRKRFTEQQANRLAGMNTKNQQQRQSHQHTYIPSRCISRLIAPDFTPVGSLAQSEARRRQTSTPLEITAMPTPPLLR